MRDARPAGRFYGALDGWRGLCACLVALYHFRAPGSLGMVTNSALCGSAVIRSAYLFTDFFFVLSGFVMAASYRDRLAKEGGVWRFLSLRLARVWPLHLVTLFLMAAGLWLLEYRADVVLGKPLPILSNANGLAPFLSNVLLVQAWHLHPWTTWNRPSWSISAEMTTYVLFALAMRWTVWPRRVAVAAVLVGAPALILVTKGHMDVTYDWGVPRALLGFVIGTVVYALTERFAEPPWLRVPGAGTLAELLALAVSLAFVVTQGGARASILAPVIFAVAVFVFAFEGGHLSRLFAGSPMRQLGLWSYSIYMLHYPLQLAFGQVVAFWPQSLLARWVTVQAVEGRAVRIFGRTAFEGDLGALIMLALLVALSALSFRFIESPPRRWMHARLGRA